MLLILEFMRFICGTLKKDGTGRRGLKNSIMTLDNTNLEDYGEHGTGGIVVISGTLNTIFANFYAD